MGATSKYKFPWPEAADLADGPDAIKDLAEAVEAKMTSRRLWTAYRESAGGDDGILVNAGGAGTLLASRSVPLVAVGWADIELSATVVQASFDQPTNWAGYCQLYVNTALAGSYRFHSHNATKHLTASLFSQIDLPASLSSLTIHGVITLDPLSSAPIRAFEVDCNVVQYGSLRA